MIINPENIFGRLSESYAGMKDRLFNNSNSSIFITSNEEYKKVRDLISTNNISIGLGGGAFLGIIQYKILRDFIKYIKPKEYVGNSIGSIIATLFATGYYDQKYFDFFLKDADKIKLGSNFHFVFSKMIPFTFEVEISGKSFDFIDYYIEHYEKFRDEIKKFKLKNLKINGLIDVANVKIILQNVFNELFEDPISSDDIQVRKIKFKDVEKKYGVKLGVLATRVNYKKFPNIFESVMFNSNFFVIDGILNSTASAGSMGWNTIQGKDFFIKSLNKRGKYKHRSHTFTDGFFSSNYPYLKQHYRLQDSYKILIAIDNDMLLAHYVLPDYGINDMVIAPTIKKGRYNPNRPFNAKNVQEIEKIADEFII